MSTAMIATVQVDAAKLQNEPVVNRLARARQCLDAAFANNGNPTLRVLVLPEFYFMHANANDTVLRWYSPAEMRAARLGLQQLSGVYQRLLVIGGTICWADQRKPFLQKSVWRIRNQVSVCYGSQEILLYSKKDEGGEIRRTDSLRLANTRRPSIDMTINSSDGNGGVIRTVGTSLNDIEMPLDTRLGSGVLVAPGSQSALKRYAHRIVYDNTGPDGAFAIPGQGLNGGVEVCQEHNSGVLQTNSSKGPVDLHFLVSNTVSPNLGFAHVVADGHFVHCDAVSKPTLAQKVNGVMTRVSNFTSVTNEVWVQTVTY